MGPTGLTTHSVLRHLDVGTVGEASQQESRARQRHLPPISVYRWWARRTESVTGALIDAVSADTPGKLLIADPFSGGGVIALAALLRGHRVYAQDVNPWAARSLATMLRLPAPQALDEAAEKLHERNAALLADAYSTVMSDGTPGTVSHTIRVATASCPGCDQPLYLFPGGLVSLHHPRRLRGQYRMARVLRRPPVLWSGEPGHLVPDLWPVYQARGSLHNQENSEMRGMQLER